MKAKSLNKKKKTKTYLCIKNSHVLIGSRFYYKGDLRQLVKAPDPMYWIELNFDKEDDQVFY